MKKFAYILIFALLFSTAFGIQAYHEVDIVDERGVLVTDISSVEIYAPDTTTNAVIYSDRGEQNTITIPMTTGSANTTLSGGQMSWFGPDGYDFSITDGTNIATNANHRTRTSSEGTIVFPSYLTSITTSQYLDAESITMGTSSDWVLNAGAVANLLTWTPASDGAIFRIGANDAATNGDFRVMVGADIGLLIDEGVPSFTWTGGAASINASSNFNTTINTGTSTGTVTLGNSAGGALTLDTTSTYTLSSDAAHSTTTTDAGADITIDSTLGSIIIDGGEAVDDAVIIRSTGAAGGIDITSLGDIDITTTGTAGEDINITNTGGTIAITSTENIQNSMHIEVNGGTSESINLYSNQGTGASATTQHDASIQLHSDDGGISLYTTGDVADAIRLEANAGTSETIHVQSVQGTGVSAATESDASIQLESTVGGIGLLSKLNAANAIRLETNGGASEQIILHSNQGTSVTEGTGSIQLLSDVGGIILESNANLAKSIQLVSDGGTTSSIFIQADTGNGVASIDIVSDVGGITLTATKPLKLECALTLNDTQTIGDSDDTPDVSGFSFFKTGTVADTIDDFDGTNIEEGQIIVVTSKAAITYDVTGGALICGTTDLITASGDITMWIYDGTNWHLISWMDDAVDQNGRG